ncbi:MAG: DUF6788 family protein [Egibacteraceae bacterium]
MRQRVVKTDSQGKTADGQSNHHHRPARRLRAPLPRPRRPTRRRRPHRRRRITRRCTRCGSPGCRCHADPPQPHGPYDQWTAKVNGKTVTRRLTERQASLDKEWIGNDRQLRALIAQMRQAAAKATELLLQKAANA